MLFFGDGAAQLLHLVINVSAEARHDFPFCSVQVGSAHVVVDAGDAPRVAFLVVGVEERSGLCALYHSRICHDITLPRVLCEHLVRRVPQAFVCSFAVRSAAMGEAAA